MSEEVESPVAINSDGTVYIGSDCLYAFKPNGNLKWFFYNEDWFFSPIISSDSTIFVGVEEDEADCLYAIKPDGTLKWRCQLDGSVLTSPAIGPDGTIYVGTWSGGIGYLYALYGSGNGDSPWSMFQHDAKHTGRVGGY
jgi:hypothetical protein